MKGNLFDPLEVSFERNPQSVFTNFKSSDHTVQKLQLRLNCEKKKIDSIVNVCMFSFRKCMTDSMIAMI